MKSTSLPAVRVEPELRAAVEAALHEGETLSEFVETAVRNGLNRRRQQAEFVARGLLALEEARQTGDYVDADTVLQGLQRQLDEAMVRWPKAGTSGA